MLLNRCPGSLAGVPTKKVKQCPQCGREVEVFSNDLSVKCDCGFAVYNDIESCIHYCKYAKDCVGEEMYKKLKRTRVAFIGVENTVRSVLATALAKEINTSPKLGFVSAGVRPADAPDPLTLAALEEESITWRGRPKHISMVGAADIFVLLGPEAEVPEQLAEGARIIRWDIPGPAAKNAAAYRQLAAVIKDEVTRLIKEVEQDGQG